MRWRRRNIKARCHVQWVSTFRVTAYPGHQQRSDVPPGALIQSLVNVDVLRFLFAVIRSVGGDANPFGSTVGSSLNFPAVLGESDINLIPKTGVPHLVRFVKIVYVKAANIGSNFLGAVIAPMLFDIPNGVTMGAWVATVVALALKLRLTEIINETNKAKDLELRVLVQVCHGNYPTFLEPRVFSTSSLRLSRSRLLARCRISLGVSLPVRM